MTDDDKEFQEETLQIAYEAYKNAPTAKEALDILAFTSGLQWDRALHNITHNADEAIVRHTLAGVLQGMVDAGKADMVLDIINGMAKLHYMMGTMDNKPEE